MTQTNFTDKLLENYEIIHELWKNGTDSQAAMISFISDIIKQNNKKHFNILEAGFGDGYTTKLLLGTSPNVSVTAVDDNAKMFEKGIVTLEQIAAQNGGKVATGKKRAMLYTPEGSLRAEYLHMGVEESFEHFTSASFDGFASGWCLHSCTLEQRERIFKGLSKVVAPGGFYANADRYGHDDEQEHQIALEQQLENYRKLIDAGLPQMYKEWIAHSAQDETHRFTPSEQQKLLTANGFNKGKNIFRDGLAATFVSQKE